MALVYLTILIFLHGCFALRVTHIPRQSVVEIEQNSHQVLRFQISSENLAPIDIRYNLNENTTAFQPRSTLNYTAVHSAIVIQACSDIVNISETCRELWVTVQGKPELNNTSINLVLLMGEPQNIRRLNVTSSITVKISSRTVNIEGTTLATTGANTRSRTTTAETTTSISASTVKQEAMELTNTKMLTLFVVLGIVGIALILSFSGNIFLICRIYKKKEILE